MTEITRVPLQPIAKGAVPKVWIGVAAVALAAAGLAYVAMPQSEVLEGGVTIATLDAGEGAMPGATDYVLVNYTGMLDDGTVFDKGEQVPFPVDGVVPGFGAALQHMQVGGSYRIRIPAELGYGADEKPGIPANSDLTFEVDLLEFKTQQEIMQMQRQMMMQGQGMPPGAMPPVQP